MTPPDDIQTLEMHPSQHALFRSFDTDKASLYVVQGPHQGQELSLNRGIMHLGRHSWCDLILDEDRRVSGHHCDVLLSNDRIRVRDLDSRNGVFVDGIQILDAYLSPGSQLQIGDSFLELRTTTEREKIRVFFRDGSGMLVGRSEPMQKLFSLLEKVARYEEIPVLLQGETGTGKTLTAAAIHQQSSRRDGPFVVVDCGLLRPELLEAELFGYVKGAFTGANQDKQGLIHEAHGGTLFLDEIAELPLEEQKKLLRVLDTKRYRRLGENHERSADFRLVAATLRPIQEELKAGRFREDLYFRISTVQLDLPPLRQRLDDLPLLIQEILSQLQRDFPQDAAPTLSDEALQKMQRYIWPGNIRDLKNVLKRAWIFREGPVLQASDLDLEASGLLDDEPITPPALEASAPSGLEPTAELALPQPQAASTVQGSSIQLVLEEAQGQPRPLKEILAEAEKVILSHFLQRNDGNVDETSRQLQLSRGWCYNRIKKHGLKG